MCHVTALREPPTCCIISVASLPRVASPPVARLNVARAGGFARDIWSGSVAITSSTFVRRRPYVLYHFVEQYGNRAMTKLSVLVPSLSYNLELLFCRHSMHKLGMWSGVAEALECLPSLFGNSTPSRSLCTRLARQTSDAAGINERFGLPALC